MFLAHDARRGVVGSPGGANGHVVHCASIDARSRAATVARDRGDPGEFRNRGLRCEGNATPTLLHDEPPPRAQVPAHRTAVHRQRPLRKYSKTRVSLWKFAPPRVGTGAACCGDWLEKNRDWEEYFDTGGFFS